MEAFAKAADGKATKIIVPSEIQGIAGLVKSITEVAADEKPSLRDEIEESLTNSSK